MAEGGQRVSATEELARLGQALYEREILPTLDAGAQGKFLVLDVESGEYEIDEDELVALNRLRARRPGAQVFLVRVGFAAAYHVGMVSARMRCSPGG